MRALSPVRFVYFAAAIAALGSGCTDGTDSSPTGPAIRVPPAAIRDGLASAGDVVYVADAEQLYAAVNDAANAGAAILLRPGAYVLSPRDASGAARPNAGRLELQEDMSISGVVGDRGAVIIDATTLPLSSFPTSFGRTGVIRTGRGRNAVEWLTIAGNPLAAAGIETDLGGTSEAWVRVAHVVAGNNARGVDIRNVGLTNAGRRLHAEIVDSDLFRGAEGIRVANFVGADRGDISVVMSGNRSYQNVVGCILENNRSSSAAIYVRSSGDRFEDNGLGCDIGGGLALNLGAADDNSTVFECHGTHFTNNSRTTFFNTTGPVFTEFGGVRVAAGFAFPVGTTSRNTAVMRLWGCKVEGNQNIDFQAFGAGSTHPSTIAGVDNHTTIELQGVSKKIAVVGAPSSPVDPSGTNTLTIVR